MFHFYTVRSRVYHAVVAETFYTPNMDPTIGYCHRPCWNKEELLLKYFIYHCHKAWDFRYKNHNFGSQINYFKFIALRNAYNAHIYVFKVAKKIPSDRIRSDQIKRALLCSIKLIHVFVCFLVVEKKRLIIKSNRKTSNYVYICRFWPVNLNTEISQRIEPYNRIIEFYECSVRFCLHYSIKVIKVL